MRNAPLALRDAANTAIAFGRAVSVLREALNSVVDMEARIAALEQAIAPPEIVEARVGRPAVSVRATDWQEMRSHVDTKTAANLLGRTPQTLRNGCAMKTDRCVQFGSMVDLRGRSPIFAACCMNEAYEITPTPEC